MNITETLKNYFYKLIGMSLPNQYSICEENNIIGKYDNDFLITKQDNFVAGMSIEGVNYNYISEENLIEETLNREVALNALNDDIEARIVVKRRKLTYNREYEINNVYAKKLINQWESHKDVYINKYYIIFETKSKGAKGFFERKKAELTTSIKEDQNTNIDFVSKINILKSVMQRYKDILGQYEPKKLSADELLSFYAEYINGIYIPLNVKNGLLTDNYIGATITFEKDYFIQDFNGHRVFNRFIGVKAYDNEAITSLTISSILHSQYELDIYLTIDSIAKERAQSKIKDKIKLAPSFAKAQLHELKELIDSDRLTMQNFSYCILVKAQDKEELNEISANVINILKNDGIIAVFETLNMQPTFFSIFPNKSFVNPRKRIHTSKTIATMVLFEKEYIGKTKNSFGDTPVTIFRNQSMSPYLFNFHADENKNVVGHTMIVGGTGAGKTTLLSFLIANLFKYDIDILTLDRLNGLYSMTEFLNGEYNDGSNFHINPFTLPNDPQNIQFLSEWLCNMINLDSESTTALDAEKLSSIEKVVRDNYHNLAPQGIRFSLKDIRESIVKTGDLHIPRTLDRYLQNPIFNSESDTLEFDKKLTTLNMDFIVEQEKSAGLIAQYLFHKMTYRAKTSMNKGFFIFIDEFKSYLANPEFNERIAITLTQARKLNGVMAMAFQDMHQLDSVKNADSFVRNLAHIIIFPTKDIEIFKKYNIFLSSNEINFLVNTGQNERKVLIKNLIDSSKSNIVDVDLSGLGKYLKILSSDTQTVQEIKRLKDEYKTEDNPLNPNKNPILWKKKFLEE